MILSLILAKSMPSVIAQGMLLFGFIYVLAKILDVFSDVKKERKAKKERKLNATKNKVNASKISVAERNRVAPRPSRKAKKRYLIELDCIRYSMECVNSQREVIGKIDFYTAIEPFNIVDDISFYKVSSQTESIKSQFHGLLKCNLVNREEHYHGRFEFQLEDSEIEVDEIELIPIEKQECASNMGPIFTLQNIIYKGKLIPLKKIPDNYDIDAVKATIAFDNYINNK